MYRNRRYALASFIAIPLLVIVLQAQAVVGETRSQYQKRYAKPTHEMNIDAGHPGLIYPARPYVIFAVFEGERSIGEMIFKAAHMSDLDIATLLKQNSPGWNWRKENIVMGKGDVDMMRAQGIIELKMWSRIDGKAFATFVRNVKGQGKEMTEMDILLVGTKEGVDLATKMGNMNKQWVPKPMK